MYISNTATCIHLIQDSMLDSLPTVSVMLSAILCIAKCACPLLYKDQFEAVLNLFFRIETCINIT